MGERHACAPPAYPGWNSGWDCPVCGSHWIHDLSYCGPGYTNEVYTWVRDDEPGSLLPGADS